MKYLMPLNSLKLMKNGLMTKSGLHAGKILKKAHIQLLED